MVSRSNQIKPCPQTFGTALLYDQIDYYNNLSTLFDENLENNIYTNVHDRSSNNENNVNDLILPSMRAHCMLNFGLKKKMF